MALSTPTAKFEHIWHALMRVLGIDHRKQYQVGKLYIRALPSRRGKS